MDRLRQAPATRAVDEPEPSGAQAQSSAEMVAWLTPDELDELNDAIRELLDRYDDRLTTRRRRPAGARLCEFVAWGRVRRRTSRRPSRRAREAGLFAQPGFSRACSPA